MLVLPGLFDFVGGVNSAINQRSNRLSNENQVTSNFVNSLNAFNLAQNTDDNLQLRSLFQQSEGPTVLDRLDDVFSRANNPFVAQQALIASQQAAPLLAQRTQQNPSAGARHVPELRSSAGRYSAAVYGESPCPVAETEPAADAEPAYGHTIRHAAEPDTYQPGLP